MTRKKSIIFILAAVLLFGFGLRIWNLAGPDMAADDALNSFRSVGYIDYVAATNRQTTPIIWFSASQWWQGLSFHDHPPLVFLAQRLFFQIGGDNLWAARMPFVLAGVLAIFAVFLLGNLIGGAWLGIASAAAMAVMNYAVWFSRIGNLDGWLIPWSVLSIYFFLKAKNRPQNYVWWGLAAGAGLATKYTFLFLGPVFFFLLVFWHRDALRQKWFWAGCAVLVLVVSPIILYNVMMWQARGHLDAALSTLFGQQPEDFYGLSRQTRTHLNVFADGASIVLRNFSPGFMLLMLFGAGALLHRLWQDRRFLLACLARPQFRRPEISALPAWVRSGFILGLSLFFALAMITAVGGEDRFGAALVPFASLLAGVGIVWFLRGAGGWKRALIALVFLLLASWELFFAVQTQWLAIPFFQNQYFVAENHPSFVGYNALDRYVRSFYETFPGAPHIILFTKGTQLAAYQEKRTAAEFKKQPKLGPQTHLLVFDDRMNWFAGVWIFERRRLYEASPIHPIGQFLKEGSAFYRKFGFTDVTIIVADERILPGYEDFSSDSRTAFVKEIASSRPPIEEIRNSAGEVIFRIFRLSLAS